MEYWSVVKEKSSSRINTPSLQYSNALKIHGMERSIRRLALGRL